jgi:hypothetical protein
MFAVDISTAVLIYLSVTLLGVIFIWVRFERSRAFRKYDVHPKEVWNCEICTYTYVDSLHQTLSRCPQCKSWNRRTVS